MEGTPSTLSPTITAKWAVAVAWQGQTPTAPKEGVDALSKCGGANGSGERVGLSHAFVEGFGLFAFSGFGPVRYRTCLEFEKGGEIDM